MGNLRLMTLLMGLSFLTIWLPFSSADEKVHSQEISPRQLPSQPEIDNTLFYHAPLTNSPTTLDPAFVEDVYGSAVVLQLFDGLVQFTPSLLVTPALAQNWQVEEGGRVYRFFLRPDATFHNGQPVEAEDVIFSLRRLFRKELPPAILPHLMIIQGAAEFLEGKTPGISGLMAEDERTVVIRLNTPYVPFLIALGMVNAKIVPRTEVLKGQEHFSRNPVGSGPFKFVSWEPDRKIALARFDAHHGGKSRLKGIHFFIYPGSQMESVLADFKAGKLHEMPVYGQFRDALRSETGLKWVHRPSLSLLFYGINCEHPLLREAAFRRALSLAIDRRALVSKVYGGQFEPAEGVLPPGTPGYRPERPPLGANLERARELMREVHPSDGKESIQLEIALNSRSALAQAELKFVMDAWEPLGIRVKPNFILDWGEFQNYLRSDALQLYRYVWYADIPDPDSFMQPLFASDSQNNFNRFQREEIDRTIREAQGMADPLKRAGLYSALEEDILTQVPIIPLFHLSIDSVYKPQVEGIEVSALGTHIISYHKVWLDPSFH